MAQKVQISSFYFAYFLWLAFALCNLRHILDKNNQIGGNFNMKDLKKLFINKLSKVK